MRCGKTFIPHRHTPHAQCYTVKEHGGACWKCSGEVGVSRFEALALALGAGYVRIGCGESVTKPRSIPHTHTHTTKSGCNEVCTSVGVFVFFRNKWYPIHWAIKIRENATHSHPKRLNATISILCSSLFTFDPSILTNEPKPKWAALFLLVCSVRWWNVRKS